MLSDQRIEDLSQSAKYIESEQGSAVENYTKKLLKGMRKISDGYKENNVNE